MKFSRNPVTGQMETYTDDGVYLGIMSTFGDSFMQTEEDESAKDGGPGSGNFGHGGRPGKVGGSSSEGAENGQQEAGKGKEKKEASSTTPEKPLKLKEGPGNEDLTEVDPGFDIFEWMANGGEEPEETEEEKRAKKEKEQKEEREKQERERYGNNGLLESDYPEDLRLTDREADLIAGAFRAYKDDDYKTEASADVMSALNGLMSEELLDQRRERLKEIIEESTREIDKKKESGYSYKTHNPDAKKSAKEKLARWWNDIYEHGAPISNWGENGIRHWQLLRSGANRQLEQIDLAKKITKRNEFAEKQPNYMPWRKNPNRDNPYYRPWENKDSVAEDGGPGSGNFGHKGRPGHVGGSGPGGGIQYRGGRSDIGFYGSRRDWLNGLQGEEQHKAVRNIASAKKGLQSKLAVKNKIEEAWKNGFLTREEADERLKEAKVDTLREDMAAEEYLLKHGDRKSKEELINLMKKSRSWDRTKDKLMNENLSEDEKKLYKALEDTRGSWEVKFGGIGAAWKAQNIQQLLEAKAMGTEVGNIDVPDDMQYELGLKERPAPPKPKGPDYSFWVPASERYGYIAGNCESFMESACGETPSYGHRYTAEEFKDVNQKFVDTVKNAKMTPTQLSSYGMRCVSGIRDMYKKSPADEFKYTQEVFDRLSDEEKDRLLDICKRIVPFKGYDDLSKMTAQDFKGVEAMFANGSPRSNAEKQLYRDYILMQEKMLTGAVPATEEEIAAKAAEAKTRSEAGAEARKRQFAEEQKQFHAGDGGKRKAEMQKKVASFDPQTIRNATSWVEVAKSFSSAGFFKDGYVCEAHDKIPNEVYADAAKSYKRVIMKFPFLAGELGGFGGNSSSHGACSKKAYELGKTEIRFNYKSFQDPERDNRIFNLGTVSKWHPPVDEGTTSAEYTVTHELGHALANWLHRTTIGKFAVTKSTSRSLAYDNEVATLLRDRTLKALKIKPTYENIKENLSEYGAASSKNRGSNKVKCNTTCDEFFAEAFAEGMLSSNPRPVAKEFMHQLELYIQENNITKDTTALVDTAKPYLMGEGEERY